MIVATYIHLYSHSTQSIETKAVRFGIEIVIALQSAHHELFVYDSHTITKSIGLSHLRFGNESLAPIDVRAIAVFARRSIGPTEVDLNTRGSRRSRTVRDCRNGFDLGSL